jgi:hypothetical protein
MSTPLKITLPTRRLNPDQVELLRSLKPGQRIKIVQTVRVGARKWEVPTGGVFREINYLATGVTTERIPEDDVVIPMVHFVKDNGELSSIAIDENTKVEVVSGE